MSLFLEIAARFRAWAEERRARRSFAHGYRIGWNCHTGMHQDCGILECQCSCHAQVESQQQRRFPNPFATEELLAAADEEVKRRLNLEGVTPAMLGSDDPTLPVTASTAAMQRSAPAIEKMATDEQVRRAGFEPLSRGQALGRALGVGFDPLCGYQKEEVDDRILRQAPPPADPHVAEVNARLKVLASLSAASGATISLDYNDAARHVKIASVDLIGLQALVDARNRMVRTQPPACGERLDTVMAGGNGGITCQRRLGHEGDHQWEGERSHNSPSRWIWPQVAWRSPQEAAGSNAAAADGVDHC